MEALQELNSKRQTASTEMCTFLIVNISSLQLIPVNVIAYRSQYGSTNPARIVGTAIFATIVSTITGIFFAKVMAYREEKKLRNPTYKVPIHKSGGEHK
jgi:spore maturation protein A